MFFTSYERMQIMSANDFTVMIRDLIAKAQKASAAQDEIFKVLDAFALQLGSQLREIYGRCDLQVVRRHITRSTTLSKAERSEMYRQTGIFPVVDRYDALVVACGTDGPCRELCAYSTTPETVWPVRLQYARTEICIHDMPSLREGLETMLGTQLLGLLAWLNTGGTDTYATKTM